ncbi:ABC transporter ATP-binding protein [Qingshengfaniella alkalisoli]|uniref:ABC transporter ATP-binding protein n=1 Tax=Qingshengfaniella alkalisoli TaxID=2599296 RepID=A0A5B8J8E5_9RHOB|nr:oligopeptide/dipeptide ABC transporter ATP-binding protein [Qingshengfaniella alkalisoli]QDY70530.1 ABC transporter ATP-binding protein [Qingshengfaniella alkalisoli]
MNMDPVLSVRQVSRLFNNPDDPEAISVGARDVSLDISAGETVGLIGESGCGKSTLARCLVGLDRPETGEILIGHRNLTNLNGRDLRRFRKNTQIVFQRPETCLNPRMSVRQFVTQPLRNFAVVPRREEAARIEKLARLVGLDPSMLDRFPRQLSGGERQRVAIMRALACEPKVVVLDEPTSALDVSVQAQVLRTLKQLREETGTAFLFISHDIAVVRYMCERVIVMYLGSIVEEGPAERVLTSPAHPYTQALLDASPRIHPLERDPVALHGELVLGNVRPGECPMRARCPFAHERCVTDPPRTSVGQDHFATCWLAQDRAAGKTRPTP